MAEGEGFSILPPLPCERYGKTRPQPTGADHRRPEHRRDGPMPNPRTRTLPDRRPCASDPQGTISVESANRNRELSAKDSGTGSVSRPFERARALPPLTQ